MKHSKRQQLSEAIKELRDKEKGGHPVAMAVGLCVMPSGNNADEEEAVAREELHNGTHGEHWRWTPPMVCSEQG